jgi:adenylate kinase family enzyme
VTNTGNGFKLWVFINGPSGAGKTTVVNALEESCGYRALRVGPYFREKVDRLGDSERKAAMISRVPVPNRYIEHYIREHAVLNGRVFLVDGLPRSNENIALIDTMAPMYFFPVFVSMNVSFATSVERVWKRKVCTRCGEVGNLPVCSRCGGQAVPRSDDAVMDLAVLSERYHAIQSVIHTLTEKHEVRVIDGSRTTAQVAEEVCGVIERIACE